jgi:hypothetical protein
MGLLVLSNGYITRAFAHRNHHMFSSISGWFIQSIGSLRSVHCQNDVVFTPGFSPLLSYVQASRESACGTVRVCSSGSCQQQLILRAPLVRWACRTVNTAVSNNCSTLKAGKSEPLWPYPGCLNSMPLYRSTSRPMAPVVEDAVLSCGDGTIAASITCY